MRQLILIVTISLIAAAVVGSTVFFVWTLLERFTGRRRAAESPDATENEEQAEPQEPEQIT